jgi:hexokinase
MTVDERARLEAEVARAEAELERLRAENTALGEDFREEPTEKKRERLRAGAEALSNARDRAAAAKAALAMFERTGSPYGLVAANGSVTGAIAVKVAPGTSKEAREQAIDDELTLRLSEQADALGVVLAAAPARYTRERPGRDPEGRTVLDILGRVEGDRLVPAVSKAAKLRKTR